MSDGTCCLCVSIYISKACKIHWLSIGTHFHFVPAGLIFFDDRLQSHTYSYIYMRGRNFEDEGRGSDTSGHNGAGGCDGGELICGSTDPSTPCNDAHSSTLAPVWPASPREPPLQRGWRHSPAGPGGGS